ncbi:MAG TPA: BrnA antitoxin family protein [Burkholderiaceae bacterium]
MKKVAADAYRDIDFTRARRGAVAKVQPGKTKISIRLDNRVLDHFRSVVEGAGEGNYQTLINDALVAYIERESMLEAVRQVVRDEVAGSRVVRQGVSKRRQARMRRAAAAA